MFDNRQMRFWVAEWVKGKAPSRVQDYLADPLHRDVVEQELGHLLATVDAQLSDLVTKIERLVDDHDELAVLARRDFEQRIPKTERFRHHVAERLAEVRAGIVVAGNDAEILRASIVAHRSATNAAGWEPTDADRALWSALEAPTSRRTAA